jgi:hypothetical protein
VSRIACPWKVRGYSTACTQPRARDDADADDDATSFHTHSFKVFRCQLPKDNPYYESKSEDAIEEDPEAAQYIYHMPEKGNSSSGSSLSHFWSTTLTELSLQSYVCPLHSVFLC